MTDEIRRQCEEARRKAEEEIGCKIDDEFAEEILELCKRKCVCAGKGEDYLPLMYRYELPMKLAGVELNRLSRQVQFLIKEAKENVRVMLTQPMFGGLS